MTPYCPLLFNLLNLCDPKAAKNNYIYFIGMRIAPLLSIVSAGFTPNVANLANE